MRQTLTKYPFWATAFIVSCLATIYWAGIATDRYVSRAHAVLQTPDIVPSGLNVSSLLAGTSGSGDLLLLKDYLESTAILRDLDEELNLRAHYADENIDRLSRLGDVDISMEEFHDYMQNRISVVFDDYAGVLQLEVQAFSPEMAQAINVRLLAKGEAHMNLMGQRLAQEQLQFIDKQVASLEQRVFNARDALISYQNEHGMVSPTQTVEAIFQIVTQLEGELAILKARIHSKRTFQSSTSPEIRALQAEADALERQISLEMQKMATTDGDALNTMSAEYESLALRVKFTLELYSSALTTLESTRVEAARKLKQVSILESPTLPEYSAEPQRIKNIFVFVIFSVLTAAIAQMIVAIIKDHQD